MLGLKTLPKDHPLHGAYRTSAGLIGGLLIALGVFFLVRSGHRWLGIGTSDGFGVLLLVTGVLLIGGALVGGNVAAYVNAYVGAALLIVGLVGLLSQGNEMNVIDLTVSGVVVLFVIGTLLLAAGFYGQVGAAAPFGDSRGPDHGEQAPETGRPATGDPMADGAGPRSAVRERR